MRLTKEHRDLLDDTVLQALSRAPGRATYYYRNMIVMDAFESKQSLPWDGTIETSDVLRAMRRLEKKGLVRRTSSSYQVMLCWEPTASSQATQEALEGTSINQLTPEAGVKQVRV